MGIDVFPRLKQTNYLGEFVVDPIPTKPGQWWYNTSEECFKFYNREVTAILGGTYEKITSIPADEFGRPNTNPPDIVDQDNLTLYSFTVNTDKMTFKFPLPRDYYQGSLKFSVIWTNDGGTDDDGRNVKWQFDYQVGSEGDVISGSATGSPISVEDTYVGTLGWIEHHTVDMEILESVFSGKQCIYLKLSAVTATAPALTCEPHLTGICHTYTAKRYVV